MLNRYYLYQRRSNGIYFIQDRVAQKHQSLRTRDPVAAQRLFNAKNQARRATDAQRCDGQSLSFRRFARNGDAHLVRRHARDGTRLSRRNADSLAQDHALSAVRKLAQGAAGLHQ